eukprot:scaffold32055_cov34-Prasinocladus_malaysianus.AAC.2
MCHAYQQRHINVKPGRFMVSSSGPTVAHYWKLVQVPYEVRLPSNAVIDLVSPHDPTMVSCQQILADTTGAVDAKAMLRAVVAVFGCHRIAQHTVCRVKMLLSRYMLHLNAHKKSIGNNNNNMS